MAGADAPNVRCNVQVTSQEGVIEMRDSASSDATRKAGQALLLWLAFMLASILVNATIPFMLGADVRAWTDSAASFALGERLVEKAAKS